MGRMKKPEPLDISSRTLPPATTPEGRENRLVSLAYDLVEQRLLNGTASSAETTAVLRLGTQRAQLEREKLEQEVKLTAAKTENLETAREMKELMGEAMAMFRAYRGSDEDEDNDEEELY